MIWTLTLLNIEMELLDATAQKASKQTRHILLYNRIGLRVFSLQQEN
jgi:hypothetical protein